MYVQTITYDTGEYMRFNIQVQSACDLTNGSCGLVDRTKVFLIKIRSICDQPENFIRRKIKGQVPAQFEWKSS